MELSEMQDLWADHGKQLEKNLRLNEALLRRLNLDKAVDEFREVLAVSVHGRNMAFIYFLTSSGLAFFMKSEPDFSITVFLGGLCMLGSFVYHLKNTRKFTQLNVYDTPVLALQKAINGFKISSISAGKYDFGIVAVWLATIIPAMLKLAVQKDIYESPLHAGLYFLAVILFILLLYPFNLRMYQRIYGEKLSKAAGLLDEVSQFEH
ncbi:MAG TPA: hypothetical protein VK541_21605 [Pedobacter sp.]|uniref:hypothetical protein n=1 Tax=Pedobacter sp. TaxID=1411316 RepID=UPI002CEB2EA6|nr:hypothetical protein [Pedobacter sp.]HMI05097.1 hypothetical protein [Pedobacter sp.]